jgi:predicted HTH transcriptional regulator
VTAFLERFLKKTRSEAITFQDFEAFLQQGIEEHQNLEYKSGNLLVDRNGSIIKAKNRWDVIGFSALAKTVAGFANAEGGLLVLGVEEEDEKYDEVVIRRRPGSVTPLPISVTKESIENYLQAKIRQPIEGITIVPVYPDKTHVIYLLDVPQSIRGPHRVDELFYYQRYNFSTLEMQHFQIADLFGKRFAPDLDVELERGSGSPDVFSLHPSFIIGEGL